MKLLRITGLILFLLSAVTYEGYKGYESNSRDTAGPQITFQKDNISVSVKETEKELLNGVTAFDEKDGDVTASLLIEEISRFTEKGKRTITYAAFDSSSNISRAEREIIYSDYTPPRFSLSKPLRFIVGETDNILQNMTVRDSIDGDLTDKIRYETQRDYFGQTEGSYHVEIMVTNSAGDTAKLPVDVDFYYPSNLNSELIPEIMLNDYLVYIKAGTPFDPESYLKSVILGQQEYSLSESDTGNTEMFSKDDILVTSNVNLRVPGVYNVEYSITTEDGYKGTAKLIVVVEE